jgi:hypothetical protein
MFRVAAQPTRVGRCDLARAVLIAPGRRAVRAPPTNATHSLDTMFTHDNIELDALILVGDDPASAERCLAALVAVSFDVPLRTWVIELQTDVKGRAPLQERCVWTRGVEATGSVSARINRALAQGSAPLVLILDGSHAVGADTVRALLAHLRHDASLGAVSDGALPRPLQVVRTGNVGPALLLRREALERAGAFLDDSRYCGVQAEAEAWCRRAERAGVVVQLTGVKPCDTVRVPRSTLRLVRAHDDAAERQERGASRGRNAPQMRAPRSNQTVD